MVSSQDTITLVKPTVADEKKKNNDIEGQKDRKEGLAL